MTYGDLFHFVDSVKAFFSGETFGALHTIFIVLFSIVNIFLVFRALWKLGEYIDGDEDVTVHQMFFPDFFFPQTVRIYHLIVFVTFSYWYLLYYVCRSLYSIFTFPIYRKKNDDGKKAS